MATMTDRELLELAALAIGGILSEGKGQRRTGPTWDTWEWYGEPGIQLPNGIIYPLSCYGDALLLAVKLGNLDLQWVIAAAWQACETEAERMAYVCRAITKLAAETGKAMKEGHA